VTRLFFQVITFLAVMAIATVAAAQTYTWGDVPPGNSDFWYNSETGTFYFTRLSANTNVSAEAATSINVLDADAFEVQNGSGTDVFNVDTNTPQITLSGGAAGTTFATFAGDATGGSKLTLAGGTWTEAGGATDGPLTITATLNDTAGDGDTDTFTGVRVDLTATDVTGWDSVYMADFQYATNSILRVGSGLVTVGAGAATTQLVLPISNDAATPTLAFGDADTGFYESADDTLVLSIAGAAKFGMDATNGFYGQDAAGPAVLNEASSESNPVVAPLRTALTTGVGGAAQTAGTTVALISGGTLTYRAGHTITANAGTAPHSWATGTFTDGSTAGSGTAASWSAYSFAQPTLAATNASVTTTNAASVYIINAPAAGANQTLTNPWSLWVDAGNVRLDGNLVVGYSAAEAWGAGWSAMQLGGNSGMIAETARGANGDFYLFQNAYFDGTDFRYISTDEASTFSQSAGEFRWSSVGSGTAGNSLTFSRHMTLDNSGRLLVGHTTSIPLANTELPMQVHSNAGGFGIGAVRWSNSASGVNLMLAKSRSAIKGSYTIVQDNDNIGTVWFIADDGTDLAGGIAAVIEVNVDDSTPAANAIGGEMVLKTSTTGGTLTEALRIDSKQNLLVNAPTLAGNLANGMAMKNGTAASASMTDSVQLWAGDAGGLAGHSGLHMRGEDDAGNLVVVGYKEESANAETPQAAATPGTICKFTDTGDASGDGIYILGADGTTWTQID